MNLALIIKNLIWQDSYCNICGNRASGQIICEHCMSNLPTIQRELCCNKCMALITPGNPVCQECATHDFAFDRLYTHYSYDYPLANILLKVKFSKQLRYVELLRRLFYLSHATNPAVDMVLIVPAHYTKYISRGFNLSYELCKTYLQEHGTSLVNVRKLRSTKAQIELDYKARTKGAIDAFQISDNLAGKSIAIIDDVVTTGATVSELARLCKAQGATRVDVWCLMRSLIY